MYIQSERGREKDIDSQRKIHPFTETHRGKTHTFKKQESKKTHSQNERQGENTYILSLTLVLFLVETTKLWTIIFIVP
jgi:hypothetical protein